MTVHSSGEPTEAVLSHLRAEEALEQDASQQALLRHECGVLEESRGDDEAAVREYLAAYDCDPDFREPLRALVRLYRRKGETSNIGRLLETMIDGAPTPQASAAALRDLAAHRLDVEGDIGQARACLESAVDTDPAAAVAWLELELVAARDGDTDTRARAIEARAGLTTDPTWQGLLLIQLANLVADAGDVERASTLLDTVVALDGRARFRSRVALEAVAARAGDAELYAHALEGQAELIAQSLDDGDLGDRNGVPAMLRTPQHAAEAWIRAGELRRRGGDPWGAVAALSAAAERLGDSVLVARLRMAAADAAGDTTAAVTIAREQLATGVGGPSGAALWMRLGLAAEAEGDLSGALEAYGKALEFDPRSVPALVLKTDLLAQGEDPSKLAESLEAQASAAGSQLAQARAWMTVSYVWAVRAGVVERGKLAMARAASLGAPPMRLSRLARSFAALAGDEDWYQEATAALLEQTDEVAEKAAICFELGRHRLVHGDVAAAVEAFTAMAHEEAPDGSRWLGSALAAYAVGAGKGARERKDHTVVQRLAAVEPDALLARGLSLVASLIACRSGRLEQGLEILVAEHDRDPSDVVVSLFLADMQRASGAQSEAAKVLTSCASALGDASLAAALQLEAGLLLWRADKRDEAVAAFEQGLVYAPAPAQLLLSWALRSQAPDDLAVRQRAIELAEEVDGDRSATALERLGLGFANRDGDPDVRAALEMLEELNPGGDIALATALARVLHSAGDPSAVHLALSQVEQLGGAAATVARAERFRMARFEERDALSTLQAAEEWADADGTLPSALEWLAATQAADRREAEISAREAVASSLSGGAAVEASASAAIVRMLHEQGRSQQLLRAPAPAARLLNLELALPGSEPTRRSAALRGLGGSLGDEAQADAARMAAWSTLASGGYGDAQEAFKALVDEDADDMASWEGFRAASEVLGDHTAQGIALAQLGNLTKDDARAGELWEQAGLVLLEKTTAHDDAEIAFQRALERDVTRAVAFDKLFRRVRARKDNDRLLALIETRLQVTEDTLEITKMYWERARVYRDKGDNDRALKCLKDVTILEPDHVGALALAGEISIKKGDFEGAAPLLAKLATLDEAPAKQRLLSGIAAVDLYEKKLSKPNDALEVLSRLYKDGLSNLKVRERLARTAARVGNWEEAVTILERLMEEREDSKGRAEAARLAMAIYRDKLNAPARAVAAVTRLLDEVPDDQEAIELLLTAKVSDSLKAKAIPVGKKLLLQQVAANPFDRRKIELIGQIAELQEDLNLQRAALGCALALGNDDTSVRRGIAEIDARSTREPQIVLGPGEILAIADPDDVGAIPEMFALAAPVVSEALGPSLKSEDVGRKQRVDAGHPMRIEVARWMGALGFDDFDVYVGGRDPDAVKGVADEKPSLVVGTNIVTPLDAAGRSAVAREVFALRRGTTSVMYCDEHTIASIVVAVCKDTGVSMADPNYTVFKEVERVVKKAMSRRVRKSIADVCQRVAQSGQDALEWAAAARRSIDRMAVIASGDASSVLDQILGKPGSPARLAMEGDLRAQRLLSFAMSGEYLTLRSKLEMGVT